MIRRLLPYWPTARTNATAGGAVIGVSIFFELLQPWPIKWLVDYVFGAQAPPLWLAGLLPGLGSGDPAAGITAVCSAILLLALLHRAGATIGQFFLIRAGARVVQSLRCHACDHLHRLSLAFHDRTRVGDSIYRVAHDAHAAQTLINGALVPMAMGMLMLAGALIIMIHVNALLTLTTLAVTPLFILTIRGFSRRINEQSRHYHESESALLATVQESVSSIRAVQAYTLEPQTRERFNEHCARTLEAQSRMTWTQLIYSACAGLAMAVGTALVVYVASHQALQGHLSVGDILVFVAYLGMLYQPMNALSQGASIIHSANAQLGRVFEIIDAVPEIRERPNASTLPVVRGALAFEQVRYAYAPDRPVLHGIDLSIAPGETVALVGRTGAGKTTLASLLLRFYDPAAGTIRLDGHDLRDLRLDWLRRQVGLVLQDPILFSASIAENILYGRPGATRPEVESAARRAQIHDFIRELPQGYDTLLGERGVNLSGGQRQRIALARAFLKDAPILILDEPTSALDAHTEEALLSALKDLMRARTTLIIAHRFSTVRLADRVVVLEHGRIVEQGAPAELLVRNGPYAALCRAQHGTLAEPILDDLIPG
jgi:ATP-binding cassette, subfamily B, bacterial